VHLDVPHIFEQSNKKNSSPIFSNQLLCKALKNTQKNLPKIEFLFFQSGIWYVDCNCRKQEI
jgi:hypothetical protein